MAFFSAMRVGVLLALVLGTASGVAEAPPDAGVSGAGVRADRVTVVGECTACARVDGRRKYFSHRAEKRFTGRAMGMIGVIDGVL